MKVAHPEGFEPPTNRIGTCYSIQLSYGCAEQNARKRAYDTQALDSRQAFVIRWPPVVIPAGKSMLAARSSVVEQILKAAERGVAAGAVGLLAAGITPFPFQIFLGQFI